MAAKGKTVTVLLRSTAEHPAYVDKKAPRGKKKKRTGTTYVTTRPTTAEKFKGVKKYDPVTGKHELFDEEKAKN